MSLLTRRRDVAASPAATYGMSDDAATGQGHVYNSFSFSRLPPPSKPDDPSHLCSPTPFVIPTVSLSLPRPGPFTNDVRGKEERGFLPIERGLCVFGADKGVKNS